MHDFISHSGASAADIKTSSSEQKILYLQNAYSSIFTQWYGQLSHSHLDRRTLATMSYLSFYDLINGEGKRKNHEVNNNS